MKKKTILFVCTHNSARSQIAQGLMNYFFKDSWSAFSAGTEESFVKPEAIIVLKEIGIHIKHHFSKKLFVYIDQKFDLIVTVCDDAKERCPFVSGENIIHKSFEDPSITLGTNNDRIKNF